MKTEIEHAKQDFGLSEYEQQVKDSTLSYGVNKKTGMAYLRGSIDPVRGEQIITSLDAMIRKLAKESDNKTSFGEQLKIDALVALCTQKPNGQSSATTSFGVIVDAETLLNGPHKNSVRETRDFGTSLSQPTIERLACDCQIHTCSVMRTVLSPMSAVLIGQRPKRNASLSEQCTAQRVASLAATLRSHGAKYTTSRHGNTTDPLISTT